MLEVSVNVGMECEFEEIILAKEMKRNGYATYIITRQGKPVAPGNAPAPAPEPLRLGDRVRVREGAKNLHRWQSGKLRV